MQEVIKRTINAVKSCFQIDLLDIFEPIWAYSNHNFTNEKFNTPLSISTFFTTKYAGKRPRNTQFKTQLQF